jgi:hypothetical protein
MPRHRIAQPEDDLRAGGSITPRLLSLQRAATYLGIEARGVQRLIAAGKISIVRLPSVHAENGDMRRILIDRFELDALVETSDRTQHDAPATITRVR